MKKSHEVAMARFLEMLENAPEGCEPAMFVVAFFREEGENIITGTDACFDERISPAGVKHLQEVLKRRISNMTIDMPAN